jgi:hypothetical protein
LPTSISVTPAALPDADKESICGKSIKNHDKTKESLNKPNLAHINKVVFVRRIWRIVMCDERCRMSRWRCMRSNIAKSVAISILLICQTSKVHNINAVVFGIFTQMFVFVVDRQRFATRRSGSILRRTQIQHVVPLVAAQQRQFAQSYRQAGCQRQKSCARTSIKYRERPISMLLWFVYYPFPVFRFETEEYQYFGCVV